MYRLWTFFSRIFGGKHHFYIVFMISIATVLITINLAGINLTVPFQPITEFNDIEGQTRKRPLGVNVLRFEERRNFCAMYSSAYRQLIRPDIPTDFQDWTYKQRRKCPTLDVPGHIANTPRIKYQLNCLNKEPKLVPYLTSRSDDIQAIRLNNSCLSVFTERCCIDYRGIPNIVHYVWYFKRDMDFSMFLSMISVIRYIKPCLILIHGEFLPNGKYWDFLIRLYPNVLHIQRPIPVFIFGKKVSIREHSGDIMRLEAMLELGGIYFDHDTVALRDLEPLREYTVTLCNQSDGFLLNSFIMAKRNATFIQLWMDGYRKYYRNDSYVYNSMFYNSYIALKRTDLVHIEHGTICAPATLLNRPVTSRLTYDWSKLYGYHLHSRVFHFQWDERIVNHFQTTIGAMARHILYGNKELCELTISEIMTSWLYTKNGYKYV